jgi:hypothetical protein
MKNLYLAMLFIPLLSLSQSITKSDIQLRKGEDYTRHRAKQADSLKPGHPGMGQLWDFSKMTFLKTNDYYFKVVDPLSTPYVIPQASYALMNYPLSDTSNKGFTYYKDTVNGYYEMADVQPVTDTRCLDPEFIYKFPLKFGDSILDDFCFQLTAFSISNSYCGTVKLKFDGTGTLKLPGLGPVQNVIRLKYESGILKENSTDSVFETNYFWYQAGIHHPLAQYSIYREKSGYVSRSAYTYSMSNYTTISEQREMKFYMYPNPCDQVLNLQVDSEPQSINLMDMLGNKVGEFICTGEHNYILDTKDLPAGIYLLVFKGDRGTRMEKIVVYH